jgi:hypothetical protein
MQKPDVPESIHDIIRRAHWQTATSVEHVAPHEYVVCGWDRDDLTSAEFWFFVETIRRLGRLEEWTPPEGFYDSDNRRPMQNTYLHIDQFAYWFTQPRKSVPMLNREHVSVQEATPTRRVVGEQMPLGGAER